MAYGIILPGGLVKLPRSGGSPALPVWTYTAGAVGDGQFTADQNNPFGTVSLTFSENSKYGPTSFTALFSHMTTGSIVYLISAVGVCAVSRLTTPASGGIMLVQILATPAPEEVWSGDYQVIFIPTPDINEVMMASGLTPFTGSLGTPASMEINTGIVINAT